MDEGYGSADIRAGPGLILLHAIFNQPDFRTVVLRSVAEENKLEDGLVRLEVDLPVKLRGEWPQFFKENDANLFEVAFGAARSFIAMLRRSNALDIVVQTDGLGSGRQLPFGGTEKDGDMSFVYLGNPGWDGSGLERVIDCGKDDGIAGNLDNDAPAGKVGDNLVDLRTRSWGKKEESTEKTDPQTH